MAFCRATAVLACVCAVLACSPVRLHAADPPLPEVAADRTAALQQAIDALQPGGTLDCQSARYQVTALHLKSNMTMQNCILETLPGAADFASPVTIDGRGTGLENISIRNVSVNGNRHAQSNIGYARQEDGGRHCFRILGRVANLTIEDSSGSYCAGDGIAFVSYGVSSSDRAADLPLRHIVVRNSVFSFNRRSGASADGIYDATFDNVAFLNNGTTLAGGLEGDRCAAVSGLCYGTGFWYEDYRTGVAGEGLSGLVFSRCVFRDNFQRSLYFLTRADPASQGYQPRTSIRIVNSYVDAGAEPLPEDYAIQFQTDDALTGKGAAYRNIAIQNTSLDGSIGLRQAENVSVMSSVISTTLDSLGYGAGITNVAFRNVQPAGKTLPAALGPDGRADPVITFSTDSAGSTVAAEPPQSGVSLKGDVVWNSAGSGPNGWICLAAGSPCAQWLNF